MTQSYSLHTGGCLDVLKTLDAESIDAIVTDPPYGLAFMGKKWDYDAPSTDIWQECLRVLKPGGHLLAFAGTRTQHRMACRIEDAGFEIRDMIAWVYGSGFPKSLDVSKAIDKAAGAERDVVGYSQGRSGPIHGGGQSVGSPDPITAPATPGAQQWAGWGTALKPALEPITLARKPLIGTVAENVLEHGTGAINVDGCRVEAGPDYEAAGFGPRYGHTSGNRAHGDSRPWIAQKIANGVAVKNSEPHTQGRWPANFIHDGSDEVVRLFPQSKSTGGQASVAKGYGEFGGGSRVIEDRDPGFGDSGSAARFFYCPKASKAEREAGLEEMESIHRVNGNKWTDQDYRVTNGERPPTAESGPRTNHHPTVKPIDLMAYLCRLITPPSGTILDPFTGSGSTGVAALREGFKFIGIELNPEYAEIARKRIENELNKAPLFTNA
jgi:site-specific DNA-methyltransferase (adenine-specific)